MDAASIELIVKDIFSGEYDRSEWISKYDSWQQADMIAQLFSYWSETDENGRKAIVNALASYVNSYWVGFQKIATLIVLHSDKKELDELVYSKINSGFFCRDLLNEMKNSSRSNIQWLEKIKEKTISKSFKESFFDTDLAKLYADVEALISELMPE